VTVPTGLLSTGDTLIIAESTYVYTSPVQKMLPTPITFNQKFYLRPRKTTEISFTS
jgi:hypothetical protein